MLKKNSLSKFSWVTLVRANFDRILSPLFKVKKGIKFFENKCKTEKYVKTATFKLKTQLCQ